MFLVTRSKLLLIISFHHALFILIKILHQHVLLESTRNNSKGDDIIIKYEPSLGEPNISNRLVLFFCTIGHLAMVAHKGQAVFANDSHFKSEFNFHVQFEFEN